MVRLLPRLGRRTSKALKPCEAKPCDAAPCLWAATVDELEGELARRRSEDDYAALAFESFEDDRIVLAVARLREARARGWAGEAPAIEACEREMCSFLEDLGDEGRWVRSYRSRGVDVFAERGAPRGLIRVRCEGVVGASVFSLCAALLEIDLFPEWLPGADEADILGKPSRFRRLLRVSGAKPYPLPRDEVLTEAYGDTCDASALLPGAAPRRGVAIYMRDAPDLPKTPGRHRISLAGGWFFEEVEGGTRVSLVVRVDPRTPFLPSWLVNWVVKNVIFLVIPMVARQAATFAEGGKHADRVAKNPDVYGEIETRLAAFGAAPAKPVVAEAVVAAPATLEESVAPTWWPALVFGYLFGFAVVWLRLSSDHRLEEGLP